MEITKEKIIYTIEPWFVGDSDEVYFWNMKVTYIDGTTKFHRGEMAKGHYKSYAEMYAEALSRLAGIFRANVNQE